MFRRTSADESQRLVEQLRAALEKEQKARETAEREAGLQMIVLREKRVEVSRLARRAGAGTVGRRRCS